MNSAIPARVAQESPDRRAAERFPVALPAFIMLEGGTYNVRLTNLAHGGASIETLVPLQLNSTMTLHCGTIIVGAVVAWATDFQIGVKFETPLTDAQVSEQVSRTLAIASRRELRLQSVRNV